AIPGTSRGDELGAMARAVEVFKRNAVERRQFETQAKAVQADAERDKHEALAALAGTFERKVSGLVRTLAAAAAELETTAHAMSATAEQTSRESQMVAGAAQASADGMHTVAGAVGELSATAREIGGQVDRSASIAGKAVED